MKLTKEGINKLFQELQNTPEYTLQDLFKIWDALMILQSYGLADMDLLLETMKHINQIGENKT